MVGGSASDRPYRSVREVRVVRGFVLLPAIGALATAIIAGPALAQGVDEPTAIVSLGDSYLSGEGSRWRGNSTSQFGDQAGTDRAYRGPLDFDVESIYVDGTYDSGCHRADLAPIHRTYIGVDHKINLACAGARTEHVIGAADGGRAYRGEAPQADQLDTVAAGHDVELVVLSIGGNDLGFTDIIIDCTVAYTTSFLWWQSKCAANEQAEVDAAIDDAMVGVVAALDEIRAVLDENDDGDARVVLLSYPSPVPRGDEIRYGTNFSRTFIGGCPFWRSDATWARDSLVPQIAAELRVAADAAGAEFLDLQDLLEGREICAETAEHSDGTPTDHTDEWARFLRTGLLLGDAEESLHPNYFGQRAIGRCIELVARAEPGGEWSCTNRPGQGARSLDLTPL